MKATELRQSILQAAVQGKLVPQDPKDEPASELLERIKADKARLVLDGKIKKEKPLLPINKDDIPYDLPDGWVWCRLGEIGNFVRGNGIKRSDLCEKGMSCIRYGEIYTTYNIIAKNIVSFVDNSIALRAVPLSYGDILMTLTGENKEEIGKAVAFIADEETVIGGDLCTFTNHGQNPIYLSYLLNSPFSIQQKMTLGTGNIIVHISCDKLASILISLPPLAEQQHIVIKVDELLSLCDELEAAEKELNTLEDHFVEYLPKSILQAAVQGKLVPQDPNDEPANELLERIKAEKARLIYDGKIKKEKPLPPIIEDEVPYDLPAGWVWCRLNDIVSLYDGSIRRGPFGSAIKKDMFVPFTGAEYKVYEQGNAIRKTVHYGSYYISSSQYEKLKSFSIHAGDIIISCAGTLGETFIIPQNAPRGIINQALLKLNINQSIVSDLYFIIMFKAIVQQQIVLSSIGSAMKNLTSIAWLKEFVLFPVPPPNEQYRITAKVDDLMALCDELQIAGIEPIPSVNIISFSQKPQVDNEDFEISIAARGDGMQSFSGKLQSAIDDDWDDTDD